MRSVMAHVETWRPYTLFYVGLVSLAGAVLANGQAPGWRLAGAWAAPTLGWLAGLYGGDYFDRSLDATAKPHRPIPSGRMRPRVALFAMCAGIAVASVIAALLNPWTVALAAVTAAAGIGYSTVFKKRGLSGHVVRGALMAAAFLFGAMATVDIPPWWVVAGAAVFWSHDAGSNLVGALRDVDGDSAGGYRTAPVRYGVAVAIRIAAGCWLGWGVAAAILLASGHIDGEIGVGPWSLLVLAAALGLVAILMVVRVSEERLREAALGAHEVLVVERLVLAAALLSAGAGTAAAVLVLVVAATLTIVAQVALRRRFEFG